MSTTVGAQLRATWPTTLFSATLFVGVAYLVWWNERQAVATTRSLEHVSSRLVTVDPFGADADTRHEGELVHACGPIRVAEPLSEPDYNVHVLAAKLKKRVQMYQWIEERRQDDNNGGDEDASSYSYYADWRDHLVDSNLFYVAPGHHNPRDMPASGRTHVAESVAIGRLALGADAKRKFSHYWEVTSDERPERHDVKLHSGAYYHGADPLVHEVGDLRVTFSYAGRNGDEYCAVGVVRRGAIAPYAADACPDPLVLLRKGRLSPREMLALEFGEARAAAWRFRLVGWFQTFAAAMSLHPGWHALLLDALPPAARLRRRGRASLAAIAATCATLYVAAFAWLADSPAFAAALAAAATSASLYCFTSGRGRRTRGGDDAADRRKI